MRLLAESTDWDRLPFGWKAPQTYGSRVYQDCSLVPESRIQMLGLLAELYVSLFARIVSHFDKILVATFLSSISF